MQPLFAIASVFANDKDSGKDSVAREPDNISSSTASSFQHVGSGSGGISNDNGNSAGSPQPRASASGEQTAQPSSGTDDLEAKVPDGDDNAGQDQAGAAAVAAAAAAVRPSPIEHGVEAASGGGGGGGEHSRMSTPVCRPLGRFRSESCTDELLAGAERRAARGETGDHRAGAAVARSQSFDWGSAVSQQRAAGMAEESRKKVGT